MRKLVNMRLDTELLARVDSVCGPRGRTEFVARALEAALSETRGPVSREQASPGPVRSSERVREAAPPRLGREEERIPQSPPKRSSAGSTPAPAAPGVTTAAALARRAEITAATADRQRKLNEARYKR